MHQPLTSLEESKALAQKLAAHIARGDVLSLRGNLGAGKTTFAQFLIQALSPVPVEVTSPTFTLLQTYPIALAGGETCECFHYDLYRIEQESALIELGFDDALENVTLIEWPERLGSYRMPVSLALSFTLGEDGVRGVDISPIAARWKDYLA